MGPPGDSPSVGNEILYCSGRQETTDGCGQQWQGKETTATPCDNQ